jgi:hypothetical protein
VVEWGGNSVGGQEVGRVAVRIALASRLKHQNRVVMRFVEGHGDAPERVAGNTDQPLKAGEILVGIDG